MNKSAKFHKDSPSGKKLNSISRERLNFRRRPILCTTLYRNLMQASNFGGTFDQRFLWIFSRNFHRRCLSTSSIPWCKKVKNDQKLKSRGVLPWTEGNVKHTHARTHATVRGSCLLKLLSNMCKLILDNNQRWDQRKSCTGIVRESCMVWIMTAVRAQLSFADVRPESLAGRAAWQPRLLATDSAVNLRQVEQELHCFTFRRRQAALLFSGYEARPRWYPFLQRSRLAATANSLYRYRFLILAFRSARLQKLVSAISSRTAWVTGRRNRQCGRSSLCSDSDDVCHCEGKCVERGRSSRKGCRRSFRPANRLCCGIYTVRDKDPKTQETHLW